MTKAEALNSIPEIVNRSIPITFAFITCPVQRKIAIDNAKWRRSELTKKLENLINMVACDGVGISIDLSELLKEDEK